MHFPIGTVVWLKGSPHQKMTVQGPATDEDPYVECVWILADGKAAGQMFLEDLLSSEKGPVKDWGQP